MIAAPAPTIPWRITANRMHLKIQIADGGMSRPKATLMNACGDAAKFEVVEVEKHKMKAGYVQARRASECTVCSPPRDTGRTVHWKMFTRLRFGLMVNGLENANS